MITGILIAFCLTGAAYLLLLLLYCYGWYRQGSFRMPAGHQPLTRISVVIAARNESANIAACINSILSQDYPSHLFQIIVSDDHSEDDTAAIIRAIGGPQLQLVSMQDLPEQAGLSYKKKALAAAIALADGELIVTTDADCIAPPGWLRHIAACYESTGTAMIAAPVRFLPLPGLAGLFQSLDFMTMQGITVATLRLDLGIMCNGANLAFTRSAYNAVNGYEGLTHIVSGDDYLLMMKIRKAFPGSIRYLKSPAAIIDTQPQPDWSSFLKQRIRWASKTGKYEDPKMTWILLLVYLFNLSLLLSGVMAIWFPSFRTWLPVMLAAKILAELCFLFPVAGFYGRRKQLLLFPFLQPLHIVYIVLAGFLSAIGKYSWKDRNIHQR